jgi:hypothetical protein
MMTAMKVVITGDREWKDAELIRERLERLPAGTTLIVGKARGADTIAEKIGRALGFTIVEEPAHWQVTEDTPPWAIRYHRGRAYDLRAGPLRNDVMLDHLKGEVDALVIAFHDDLERSSGTKDCVTKARRRQLAVDVVTHEGASFTPGVPALF